MNQWKDRKKKLRRESQRVIVSNGKKGWNYSKSVLSLIWNKNKVGQAEKNMHWQNKKIQHTLWNINKKKKQD